MMSIAHAFEESGNWLLPMTGMAVLSALWLAVQTMWGTLGAPFERWERRHFPSVFWLLGPVTIAIVTAIAIGATLAAEMVVIDAGVSWKEHYRGLSTGIGLGLNLAVVGGVLCAALSGGAALGMGLTSIVGAKGEHAPGFGGALACLAIGVVVAIGVVCAGAGIFDDLHLRGRSSMIIASAVLVGGLGCALMAWSSGSVAKFDGQPVGSSYGVVVAALFCVATATAAAVAYQGFEIYWAVMFVSIGHKSSIIATGWEMIADVGLLGAISLSVIAFVGVCCVIRERRRRWSKADTINAVSGAVMAIVLFGALSFAWVHIATFSNEFLVFLEASAQDAEHMDKWGIR